MLSPTDSFADVCYASAVYESPAYTTDERPAVQGPSSPKAHRVGARGGALANLGYYDDSEESDDDPTTPVFDTGYHSEDGFPSPTFMVCPHLIHLVFIAHLSYRT